MLQDLYLWALTDSNRRPSACKADALNQLKFPKFYPTRPEGSKVL